MVKVVDEERQLVQTVDSFTHLVNYLAGIVDHLAKKNVKVVEMTYQSVEEAPTNGVLQTGVDFNLRLQALNDAGVRFLFPEEETG